MRHWLISLLALAGCLSAAAHGATLGIDHARHFLARTSFAAPAKDVERFSRLTREQAVDRLLSWVESAGAAPAPSWVNEPPIAPRRLREMTTEERRATRRMFKRRAMEMRVWWMQEMLTTRSPFTEKMVFFWHNHFVSSAKKVRQPQYMYRQHLLLRSHALGNFGEMLYAIARDPAMVIYLDGASNKKGQPNENFAREVMELFTLGEGQYSERDVKEAARAFTGWSVNPHTGDFLFRKSAHDYGMKTVFERSGNWDGNAILEMLLRNPRTAEFIVAKLWREFVSPDPDPAEVRRIGALFHESRYDIRVALRGLLTSDAFYDTGNRASLFKSPLDLVVGTLRQFQFTIGDVRPFVVAVSGLGQNLFAPPNVKGWPGGAAWINSTTLLARRQFIGRLFRGQETRPVMTMAASGASAKVAVAADTPQRVLSDMAQVSFNSERWLRENGGADSSALARRILATAPHTTLPAEIADMEVLRRLTQDPVYQLK